MLHLAGHVEQPSVDLPGQHSGKWNVSPEVLSMVLSRLIYAHAWVTILADRLFGLVVRRPP